MLFFFHSTPALLNRLRAGISWLTFEPITPGVQRAVGILFLSLGILVADLHAEAGASAIADDCIDIAQAQALTALKNSEAWAKKITTFGARFSQESTNQALGASEQSGGNVLFINPGKMRWQYEWPEQQDFIITENTMQLYQPALKQLLIDSASIILSSDLPVAFLSGLATVTDKFKLVAGCKMRPSNQVQLTLKPKEKSGITELHLSLDPKNTGRVYGASIIDASENITSFTFSQIIEGKEILADQFVMHVPKGTDVQDNRKK